MKTTFASARLLLLTVFITSSFALFAQAKEADKKPAEQPGLKKGKKIEIVEKEKATASESTELNVTFSNFTPDERAKLIQQLLDMKDCQVEMRQVKETDTFNSEKTKSDSN